MLPHREDKQKETDDELSDNPDEGVDQSLKPSDTEKLHQAFQNVLQSILTP